MPKLTIRVTDGQNNHNHRSKDKFLPPNCYFTLYLYLPTIKVSQTNTKTKSQKCILRAKVKQVFFSQ